MANTKSHPGMFRCYEAALPDEPMFVILGRDPAGPATLEFWAQERVKQQKVHEPDDQGRIKAAIDEAKDMASWRQRIMDHAVEHNEVPAWKLPRPTDEPGDRPIRMSPELGMPYGGFDNRLHTHRELMVSVGKNLRDLTHKAQEAGAKNDLIVRFHAEIERLAEAARAIKLSDTDPYAEFAKNLGKPVEHEWYEYADTECEHPRKVLPLSYSRMHELLDYATAYGQFDENTPSGTLADPEDLSSPMNDMRRAAIWQLKRCMGVIPEGGQPPVADDTPPVPTVPVYVEGLFAVPGVDSPQSMDQIAAMYRKAAQSATVEGVKMPTLDSAPEDLAHAPEVPHHRFSAFHEAGDYAYARGLEVNPIHLATALDAMAKSGWHLCAIFGQTDQQHIGFIFRREVERFSAFEIAHGYDGGFEDTRPRGSTFADPAVADAYASGKPLDEIVKMAFKLDGLDPETTHHRDAKWTDDLSKLRQAMESLRPDKRTAFLLREKAENVTHYWRVASVGSVLRLIHLLDWHDRIALVNQISPEAFGKVLGCGGDGQEPCPEWGRGLAI